MDIWGGIIITKIERKKQMKLFRNLICKLYYGIYMEIENPNRKVGFAILFTVIPTILLRFLSWTIHIPRFIPNIFIILWPLFILFIPTIAGDE